MNMNNIKKPGPKDVFGYLVFFIGLYVSVIFFGALLFFLIDYYFPDVLHYDYARQAELSLKWPLAILVIIFPLYVWLTGYLRSDLERNHEKKELRVRKWLLYFTLFVTSMVIIGDLVTLIYRFLNGDLTIQFVLKVLAVLLIAAAVFAYYVWNIRKDTPATRHPVMKLFVYGVLGLGALFIALGFFVSGSPFEERLRRFDERRIQDLQTIQYEVINFWQVKEKLPQTLDELRDDIRGFTSPRDPATGDVYRYSVVNALQFELCAVFETANKENISSDMAVTKPVPLSILREAYYYPPLEENWVHSA